LAKALDPGDDFEPLPWPGPSDWLAVHPEAGQTYEEFVQAHGNRPDPKRGKIYLQPLGEFPPGQSPDLESLKDFAAAYFVLPVHVLPALAVAQQSLKTRLNPISRHRQLYTGDVLALLRARLPAREEPRDRWPPALPSSSSPNHPYYRLAFKRVILSFIPSPSLAGERARVRGHFSPLIATWYKGLGE